MNHKGLLIWQRENRPQGKRIFSMNGVHLLNGKDEWVAAGNRMVMNKHARKNKIKEKKSVMVFINASKRDRMLGICRLRRTFQR